ncbi:MAG: IS1380 family transposase [Cyanobacteriota bacterium]
MTKCHQLTFYNKKDLTLNFNGGDITSDAGLLPIKEFDNRLKFRERIINLIKEKRDKRYTTHKIDELFNQRFYSILAGYEDCNDAKTLKIAPVLKDVVNKDNFNEDLASQSTLSGLENMVDIHDIFNLQKHLMKLFIESFDNETPKELTIDIDATDINVHGHQQLTLFNGYYKQNMYSPLIISSNGYFLNILLRKGNAHGSWNVIPRLQLVIGEIKKVWPDVNIIIRIDAGGATPEIYKFCEFNEFKYVIGLIKNLNLKKEITKLADQAEKDYKITQEKQQLFGETLYQANSWKHPRRVIMKAEQNEKGSNKRFLVTNIEDVTPENLYKDYYSPRGDFERIIDDLKNGFKAYRLSCHSFIANQFQVTNVSISI